VGYQFLLSLNPAINFVRRQFGLGYWSLSAYAKKRVKDAVSFIGRFEEEIVRYAKKFSVDAVLCGHIHNAAIRQFGDITYYNCGDWVETCSALIEREDGTLELVNYHPFSGALVPPVKDRVVFTTNEQESMNDSLRHRASLNVRVHSCD
jgi:UDP-2,3-diacylglucosamine pyrophosphatase LpxH